MTDINDGNEETGKPRADDGGGDDNKRQASAYDGEDRKMRALAGQWKTPPAPAYLSASQGPTKNEGTQQQSMTTTVAGNDNVGIETIAASDSVAEATAIPNNPKDYEKALKAAYRKGAAAAMAAQQQQQLPTAASCPDFSTGSSQQHGSSASEASQNGTGPLLGTTMTAPVNSFPLEHQIHPPPQQQMQTSIPDPLASSMPPPLPQAAAPTYVPHPHHPSQSQITYAPQQQPFLQGQQQQQYPAATQQPQSQMTVAPLPQPVAPSSIAPRHAQPISTSELKPPPPQSQQQPSRSMSMPDMSTYAAEAEEEKRLKRLARNRASARLRRLRKKNLVDAYETEVGILEKTLQKLEAHKWGDDTDDHSGLLDALGMARGQQYISAEERKEIIQDILRQQKEQVDILQEAQTEQEILSMLAWEGSAEGGENKHDNSEEDMQMLSELQEILQLSDDQKAQLRESSEGLDQEVEALETVALSLEAIQKNEWLINEGVQDIAEQFTSILHKNQQSKLLLWTDANAEAIDQLDLVEVQQLQNAPVFTFGVEASTPNDDA